MAEVTDNRARHRYELDVGGTIAFVEYVREPHAVVLVHTEVPQALSGQGVGSRLAKGVLERVKTEGGKVVPRCEFIAGYIGKHPEYAGLVAEA